MIMLGAVVFAASVQAASVTWSSGALKTPVDSNGGWSSTTITSGSATGYFWVIDAATYGSLYNADVATMMGNVMDKYASIDTSAKTVTITDTTYKSPTTATTLLSYKDDSGYSAGDTAYVAMIFTYNDGAADYYIANVASWTFATSSNKSIAGLGTNLGGTGGTALGGWQSVPEPTSGLLMLLGMAGLALRRRRA